jgi:tetratricopeptide (TPR) repeat protein
MPLSLLLPVMVLLIVPPHVESQATRPAGTTAATAPKSGAAAPDRRLAQAEEALAAGDVDKAFGLATAAAGDRPNNAPGHVMLARVHLARGGLEAAWAALDRAVRLDPRNVDALAYLGFVGGRLATAAFERLKEEAPESARVRQLEAETYELQERKSDAETSYEAALAADPRLLDALLPLARLKRGRLACEEAIALYERAEAVRPTFDAAYGMGFCLAYMQEDAAAVDRFEQAVKRDPTAAVAWSGLGTSLVRSGRQAQGIDALKRALAIEPKMSDGWYKLGMAYQAAGDTGRAKEAFSRAEALRTGSRP